MKMSEAMEIIESTEQGFMVSFEWVEGCMLRGDHFPDKHAGEPLIPTEEEAWTLAASFAQRMRGKVVNLYVTGPHFTPVANYRTRYIENR